MNAKMKAPGEKDLVTVVGSLPGINPGKVLELLGEWSNHPKFVHQFKVVKFKSVMPTSVAGMEKYLRPAISNFPMTDSLAFILRV